MSDIVERLRFITSVPTGIARALRGCADAADEIERLRRENADVECHNAELGSRIEYLRGILVRIDNCDAIEINRDYSEDAIAIAEVIWDDIHAALAPQTECKT